jgi:hypothetical protein
MLKVRLNTIASCLFFPNLSTFLCNLHFIALSNNECLAQNNPVSFCNLTRWHTCDLFISAHTRQLWSRVHTILFNFHLNLATTADSNVYAHSISVTIIPISRTVSFQLYMKGLALLLWLFRFPPSFSKSHSKSIDSDVHLVNFIIWAHRLLKEKWYPYKILKTIPQCCARSVGHDVFLSTQEMVAILFILFKMATIFS